MKVNYSIEEYRIYETEPVSLAVIDGWAVKEDGSFPVLSLSVNDQDREIKMVRLPKEDIVSKYHLKASSSMCGFRFIASFEEKAETLVIKADEETVLSLDRKQIEKASVPSGIVYYIDNMYFDGESQGTVSGWAYAVDGSPLQYEILDEAGNVKTSRVRTYPRIDQPVIGEDSENRAGFQIGFMSDGKETVRIYTEKYETKIAYNTDRAQKSDDSKVSRVLKKVNESSLDRLKNYYRQHGFLGTLKKIIQTARGIDAYHQWFLDHKADEKQLELQRTAVFSYTPKISIVVPVFNTPKQYLEEMIDSVQKQTYENWQLCIADGSDEDHECRKVLMEYAARDARICVTRLEKNYGISGNTNRALEMAEGEYTGLFDHDDLLEPDMLYEIVKSLQKVHHDVIYTDEDKLNSHSGRFESPVLKPDFDLSLIRSENYITHFFVAKTALIKETGGFHSEYDGSQDFDLTLRCTEKASSIHHIPKVLYHWRMHGASTAEDPTSKLYCYESGEKAVRDHLGRMGIEADVKYREDPFWGTYQVCYRSEKPRLSVILKNYSSREAEEKITAALKEAYQDIEFIPHGRSLNEDVWMTSGRYVLILDGVQMMNPDNLAYMTGCLSQKDTAVVSGMVLGNDGMIISSGLILNENDGVTDAFAGLTKNGPGQLNRAVVMGEFSAVSSQAVMIRKRDWNAIGGIREEYSSDLGFADFCLRLREKGRKIVYCPYAVWINEEMKEREEGKEQDVKLFLETWKETIEKGDPFYNRNYDLSNGLWSL